MTIIDTRAQNFIFLVGENLVGLFFFSARGARIKIDVTSAITPPNLEGIDRKIT